jgi:hypothetical protein
MAAISEYGAMASDPEGDLCRIEVGGVGGAKIEGLGFPDLFFACRGGWREAQLVSICG